MFHLGKEMALILTKWQNFTSLLFSSVIKMLPLLFTYLTLSNQL